MLDLLNKITQIRIDIFILYVHFFPYPKEYTPENVGFCVSKRN